MGWLLLMAFFAAAGVIAWSAYFVVIERRLNTNGLIFYIAIAIAAAAGAVWSTFYYVYFPNENTRFHGWPVPYIVFQRVDADSRWADYVGPTLLVGMPMNFIIFMLAPAIVFLFLSCLQVGKSRDATRE